MLSMMLKIEGHDKMINPYSFTAFVLLIIAVLYCCIRLILELRKPQMPDIEDLLNKGE